MGLGAGEAHHTAVFGQFLGGEGGENGLPVLGGLGGADEQGLKLAIVQAHQVPGQVDHAADGHGVGHHAVDELPFHLQALVGGDLHLVAGEVHQPPRPLQHIGQVAQQVFGGLGGGVGHVGEQPEGGDVEKLPSAQVPHVDGPGHTAAGHPGQLLGGAGQVDIPGKVIGGARRDIAQNRSLLLGQGEQPAHRLVEGAVPAAAHHPVIVGGGVCHHLGGVSGA